MSKPPLETPILMMVFNRPDTTRRVFEAIRSRRPKKFYVAADGPRPDRREDTERCLQTRQVFEAVDWDCEFKTLFRDENMGCRRAVEGALEWFFSQEEEGIILEDDTLPQDAFFDYCAKMLDSFRNDERVFSINGCSLGYESADGKAGLTAYFNMWGWATWRRSLEQVRQTWGPFESGGDHRLDKDVTRRLRLKTIWDDKHWVAYWQRIFAMTAQGKIDTWDYQWLYTALKTGRFCVRPASNRVVNIGFGPDATHTTSDKLALAEMRFGMECPLETREPVPFVRDRAYENNFVTRIFTRYDIVANSRLYRLYDAARRTLKIKR
jgi:hypothetical protein